MKTHGLTTFIYPEIRNNGSARACDFVIHSNI